MAIFLFMFHNINLLKIKSISSKLQIETANNLIITNIIPESVNLKLRGNENDIAGISGSEIITFIDLSAYKEPGTYHVPVQIIKSGTALNVDPLEISVEPADISINLDKLAVKSVPVFPDISGKLASGYYIISEKIEPSEIQIEGPEAGINAISEIKTETFDISDRYNDFSLQIELVQPGPSFTFRGNPIVQYSAVVKETSIQKDFSDIYISAVNLNEAFTAKITPETGGITLRGAYAELNAFVPDNGALIVDCSSISEEGTFELNVTPEIGQPLTLYSYQPEKVTVEITKRKE
jgi:YbbR domain-containing protein